MPDTTIRVTPALLQDKATRFVAEAITVRELSGRVHTALATTGEEAAGLQLSEALSTCARRLRDNLILTSLGLADTGEALARASVDYTGTETVNAAKFATYAEKGGAP